MLAGQQRSPVRVLTGTLLQKSKGNFGQMTLGLKGTLRTLPPKATGNVPRGFRGWGEAMSSSTLSNRAATIDCLHPPGEEQVKLAHGENAEIPSESSAPVKHVTSFHK